MKAEVECRTCAGVAVVHVNNVAEMLDVVKVANKLNPEFPDEE